jgi:ribose 1,5-bisphosphate isomerase
MAELYPRVHEVADAIETIETWVAAAGSVVNEIRTSGLGVVARERGTPVVDATQTPKLDPATLTGNAVEIERRAEAEVVDDETRRPTGDIEVENPTLDVTPPRYIDATVTERGQLPTENIVMVMRELSVDGPTEPWQE